MPFSDPVASPASANPYISGLLNGSHWQDPGSTTTTRLAVNIAGTGAAQIMEFNGTNVTSQVNAAELAAFNAAMALIASVCNVTFSNTATQADADLRFGVVSGADMAIVAGAGTLGVALTPDAAQPAPSCPLLINRDSYAAPGTTSLQQGGFDFKTFVHEILHTLGLKHTHDTGDTGNAPFPGVTPGAQFGDLGDNNLNQGIWSVMSYNDGYRTGPLGLVDPATQPNFGWEGTPMAFDIAALQLLYGANTTFKSGNDIYTLPSINAAGSFYSCLWDTGGIDTIRNTSNTASTIDLREATLLNAPNGGGFVSSVTGIHGGFTIAKNAVIENATGGGGIDTLIGNAVANTLDGGGAADTLIGGDGGDVYYIDALDTVTEGNGVNSGIDTIYARINVNLAGYANVENLVLYGSTATSGTGTGVNNTINAFANTVGVTLTGLAGDDVLRGTQYADTLIGGIGKDILIGNAALGGINTMTGGDNDDAYYSSRATDVINENLNEGFDIVFAIVNRTLSANTEYLYIYGTATSGTGNTLANTINGFNSAQSLTLDSAQGNDVIYGSNQADIITGGTENDVMNGYGGADTFRFAAAGTGADQIFGFDADPTGGQDRIDVSGRGFNAGSIGTAIIVAASGANTLITIGADTILLHAVAAANVTATDFLF